MMNLLMKCLLIKIKVDFYKTNEKGEDVNFYIKKLKDETIQQKLKEIVNNLMMIE